MSELTTYKREAGRIAKELGYPKTVCDAIRKANSENEISHIMCTARKNLPEGR